MTTTTLTAGTKVEIRLPDDAPLYTTMWYPKGRVTGTVQKVFKNGKIAVAIDQIHNGNDDRLKRLNMTEDMLFPI